MELPTYTNIWCIEKRLYSLYDFRLPMPVPVGQIAVFAHHSAVRDPPNGARASLQPHAVLAVRAATGSAHLAGHPAGAGEQAPAGTGHFPGALLGGAWHLVPDELAGREGRHGGRRQGIGACQAVTTVMLTDVLASLRSERTGRRAG